ncbi:hypothetical protein GFS24_10800 [Chitinophaga sp. SYP-B3965]|uniref:nuclear transport factor 2 family protein n=1 Tax=Chitinophaga sp. SYP-B3965 TaxID=2663120 RepID=UPI001299BAC2|nr:nuclear transport factor 2 family protein [Chitinophaga sp. SYP-B3965]MRG45607.1 hypothetical protein [Chitinophaga sp. SYP-B3965]
MKRYYAILFILLLICSYPVLAQSSEEVAVKSAIQQLFDGMKKGDSAMVKAVFAERAVLHTIQNKKDSTTTIGALTLAQFLVAVGTPHTDVWDERITFDKILIDGSLASVWTPYRFFLNDQFSHCGVNSFQLYKTGTGWKIIYLVDTRRKDKCL